MKRTITTNNVEANIMNNDTKERSKATREKNRAIKEQQYEDKKREYILQQKADSEVHPPLSVDERAVLQTEIDSMRTDLELIRVHGNMTKELNRAIFYLRNGKEQCQPSLPMNN